MVKIINHEGVNVDSKKDMIAVTQELDAGVECNIRELTISLSSYDDYHIDDLSKLFRLLVNRPTLHRLYITSQKGISFENATCISNLLNPNINPLGRLSNLQVSESSVTDEHVVEICKGLENNKFLFFLILRDNEIGDSGATSLGKVLATINSIGYLDLRKNEIGDTGAKAIAEGIMQRQYPSHSNIARHYSTQPFKEFELYLADNITISDLGAKAFASLLHKQHSALSPLVILSELHLSECDIGDEGAVAIAESLKSYNSSVGLKELNLSDNRIGNAGAIAFANALKENKVLTYLHLGNNEIRLDGDLALCQTRKAYNVTLETFYTYGNPSSYEVWLANISIGEYERDLHTKRKHQKAAIVNNSKHCQLVKANKVFNFISY